jgi:cytidyltransferase-like protein
MATTSTNGHTSNGHNNNTYPPVRYHASSTATDLGSNNNHRMVRATEGWLELFLTPSEKLTFSNWNEVVRDKSLVNHAFSNVFDILSKYLPDTLAPSIVTLTGFLALGQAWYLTNAYGSNYSTACTVNAMANIFLFFCSNSLSGRHADRIRQHTALSDLFQYSCDMGSTVWLSLLTTYCLGGTSVETQWYAVQVAQLVLFLKHLSAFKRQDGLRYHLGAGPGEVLVSCMVLLAVRATVGQAGVQELYNGLVVAPLVSVTSVDANMLSASQLVRMLYYGIFVAALLQSLNLPSQHGWTRFGLVCSLIMRLVPALLLQAGVAFPPSVFDVVCDGLFLAVLTSDLTLAKMAGRELHPWVVLMSLAAVLSYTTILTLVAIYYIAVFSDLCFYMNLPLLATCRNVYCDGVYDLCHIGHKKAFVNALGLGNRLLVGVMGDEDCAKYKRPPIMSHDERCAEVEACKAVTKVIPNAPCFGLTQEFLDEHQIHVVAFGEEYLTKYPNPDDDPYYGLPRRLGIACPLPRTNTLSTTDLIRRIQLAEGIEKMSPT